MAGRQKSVFGGGSQTSTSDSQWLELSPSSKLPEIVAGVDEVGRGALFGPVVAAAVILPQNAFPELISAKINDSKKLSANRRSKLAEKICELALDWKIGCASPAEIDKINILQASLLAMKRAIIQLEIQPKICLIDGNQIVKDLPQQQQQTIVKGDSKSLQIAAASIVAKVWRDRIMIKMALEYPMYGLEKNKGYGSKSHLIALEQHGPSPWHRHSFSPCQKQMKINLEI